MAGIRRLFTDTASVETCIAQAPSPAYAAPVTVSCFAQARQEPVRDPDGYVTASSLVLYASPADAGKFTFGSKVAVSGHDGYVISAYTHEHGPQNAWHVKVLVV